MSIEDEFNPVSSTTLMDDTDLFDDDSLESSDLDLPTNEDLEVPDDLDDNIEDSIAESQDISNNVDDLTKKTDSVKDQTESFTESKSALSNGYMDLDKGAFTITPTTQIEISDLAYSNPMKDGRKETVAGLTKSVRESGVLNPVQVILLPEPDEEEKAILAEDGETAPKYLLIDGMRRVFASLKNNIQEIPADIWDFKDKQLGQNLALELGLWLNRTQKHSWREVWDLYTILEEKSQIKPAMAEYLFSLEPGDAMKLKDVMLCEYDDIKDDLLIGNKSLEQCYKQLMKERKEEDEIDKADRMGLSDTNSEANEVVDNESNSVEELDNEEVKGLMEMMDKTDEGDVSEDDFNELNASEADNTTVQDTKHRTYIDPQVKKAALFRDNFTCQCCGTGGVAFLDVIIFHHIIPVHAGGPDTVDNGITLCDTCHLTLHVAERNGGRLPMSKEQFDAYSPAQKERILHILKLAKVAFKADKLKGYSLEEIEKLARAAAQHRMPGQNIKENMFLYQDYKSDSIETKSDDKDVIEGEIESDNNTEQSDSDIDSTDQDDKVAIEDSNDSDSDTQDTDDDDDTDNTDSDLDDLDNLDDLEGLDTL